MKLTQNQQAWVAALRSGEFKQGRDTLQHGDSYCCLGVLCVVAERHGVEVTRLQDQLLGSTLYKQSKVRTWVGLITHNGDYQKGYLTKLNDDGKSFAEIADIIEQNAESLFTHNVPN